MNQKITPAATERCAAHTLQEQLAQLRELERLRILAETIARIHRECDELRYRPMPNDED